MATTETNRAEVRINDLMGPRLEALGKKASLIGIAGVVLSLAGAVASPHTFFQSYLFAYMLVFGWTIGSTAWLMAVQYQMAGFGASWMW